MAGRFTLEVVATPSPALVARGYFLASDQLRRVDEPLSLATERMQEQIAYNFATESAAGDPWSLLADSTLRAKSAQGLDPRILRATGELFEGATSSDVWDVSQTSYNEAAAVMVDPTGYGELHIEGYEFLGHPVDARDYTAVHDETLEEMDEVFYDWVDGIMGGV